MSVNIRSRNWSIDLLKLIAAYFIVSIHVPFYGELGVVVTSIARFAVPVFFITAGYFCKGDSVFKIRNRQKHIIHIFIFASILYNICNIFSAAITSGSQGIWLYLCDFMNKQEWIEFILFNDTISATRLWFLPALVYTYSIQKVVVKKNMRFRGILILSIILLIINLFCSELLPITGKEIPVHYTRNFLFTGYPLFGIGLCLNEFEDSISSLTSRCLKLGIIFGIVYSIASVFIFTPAELTLGSVIMAVSAFVLATKCSSFDYSVICERLSQCSLGIYILHRPMTTVIGFIGGILGIGNQVLFNGLLLPILVCIFTTICVLCLNMLMNRSEK